MKNKGNSYKRVQNPLIKKKPTVPKFQNESKIYSIKNIAIQEDKKFQTEEQIQTEKQGPTFKENSPSHKNKNRQREWKRSTIDILATKQPAKQNKLKNKSLSVYYCDSIAIRPMTQNQKLTDIFNTDPNQNTSRFSKRTRFNKQQSITQKQVDKDQNSISKAKNLQSTQIQQILSAQMKNRFKSRKKIFNNKQGSRGLKMSRAIRTQMQKQKMKQILGVDEFHITFQEDIITQCCT